MNIEFKINFERMLGGLFFDNELVKQFDLNKKTPGTLVDYFYWDHELEDDTVKKVKHEIIVEMGRESKGIPITPIFQIYPLAGNFVLQKGPKQCDIRKGTIEDYFNNHKHYEEKDD